MPDRRIITEQPASSDELAAAQHWAAPTSPQERAGHRPVRRPPAANVAAIDVGTNSIHLIIAEISPDGDFQVLGRDRDMIQLGKGGFAASVLTPEAMANGIETLRRFKRMAEAKEVTKFKAVATSAVREAHNGGEFVEQVRKDVGLDLQVISAEEEGRLIYLGARHAFDLGKVNNLIIDIGGGSVELIRCDALEAHRIDSVKLGGSRLAELFLHSDPPKREEIKALRRHIGALLAPSFEALRQVSFDRVIGTSGTVRHLGVLCGHRRERGADAGARIRLSRGELKDLLAELLAKPRAARLGMRGMEPKRVDAAVAAATVLYVIMEKLDLRDLEHVDAGLREGLIVDYIGRHRDKLMARATWPDPRARSVVYLAERCHYHKVHAEQVARLALAMFDGLRDWHGIPAAYRELLFFAGILHDIGYVIGHQGHHKHSYYLISNGELRGFEQYEIEIIANIARYHRKDRPKKSHYSFQRLRAEDRRPVAKLASILRLADALDRTHYSVVESLKCTPRADGVCIEVVTRRDAELELWTAQRNVELFEREFGVPLELHLSRSGDAGVESDEESNTELDAG